MIEKKTFVIFGGYGSVGSALAQSLSVKGHNLLLAGRNREKLALVADCLQANFYCADCTRFNEVEDCLDAAKEAFGNIDGIAHCIGSICIKPAHLTVEREWAEVISTNLTSAFACVKYAVQAMRQNGGSIVLTSSVAASVGIPNHEAISAAKAGIVGLTRSAAATYARHKIRVNAVSPGFIESNLNLQVQQNKAQMDAITEQYPLGRVGTVSDIASAIEYLLVDSSTWITGQVIGIDGGFSTLKSTPKTRH